MTITTDDNAIVPELAFDPERGALTFNGVRYFVLRPETLHGFFAATRTQLGDAAIGDVLFAGGFVGGHASATNFAGETPEATIDYMCRMGRDIGWGCLRRLSVDVSEQTLVIEADASPFAEAAVAAGDTGAPICHLLRGVVGGLLSAVCGAVESTTRAEVVETECVAAGADRCRFEGRLVTRDTLTPAPPLRQKFDVLAQISRAQHFAWREAVAACCPGIDAAAVAEHMWEISARETAKAYIARIDPKQPVPRQLAQHFAWSSIVMNEAAIVESSPDGTEARVVHYDCPWFHWHKRLDLLAEDRPGCDAWFFTVVEEVAAATGVPLKIETLSTLPDGDATCARRITEG